MKVFNGLHILKYNKKHTAGYRANIENIAHNKQRVSIFAFYFIGSLQR
mgnify:CR=1 FL=1